MKRICAFLLCLCLSFGLCACALSAPPAPAPTEDSAEAEAEERANAAAAYEAAVQAVRDEFVQVIESGVEEYDEDAHSELPWYTAILTRYPENSYYEAFYDFDGNGVDEMIIGVGNETGKTPVAVYAFDGQDMRYLCKEHPLGERAHLSREDGLFIVHASGGAAQGELILYRIAPDGWSAEIVDVIDYQFSDAEHVSYYAQMGNVFSEELVGRYLTDMPGLDFEPEWSCFYARGNK